MIPLLLLALAIDPERLEWKVDDVDREGIVYAPSKPSEGPLPLVFGFHGHGGSMRQAARSFRLHEEWPEAVVVYLQGLPTPSPLVDPEGKKSGWQNLPGGQGDRDLKLFDAALATIKTKFKIDERRIYATGHSNGGQHSYLLGGQRREVLAAVAPCAAAGARLLKDPIPLFHIAGRNDPLVKFAMQERSIAAVRTLNGCEAEGKDWAPGCTLHDSSKGAPLLTFIHDGDHKYPAEAPALIVRFFKDQARK